MNDRLEPLLVGKDATIRDALSAIDRGGWEIALVVDLDRRLVGVLTDGDLRRGLLAGAGLDAAVAPYVNTAPWTVAPEADRAQVLDLMRVRMIEQIPVVDARGALVGLHVMREMLGAVERPNWAVIMAGGRGRRLGALTDDLPKPMLPVAGQPILERLVHHLVGSGIGRILLAVNYRAEVIEAHFGDGSAFGCRIHYLREDPDRPLGTAGSLALVEGVAGLPEAPILVMNGDLVTQFSVEEILAHHRDSGAAITVAVRDYRHEVPFGVLDCDASGRVTLLTEKPVLSVTANAGIYVIEPSQLSRVSGDGEYPITALIEECLGDGCAVTAWAIRDEWHDVGRPEELRRARGEE